MAEYGLYGAMVRHSLPLPDAILRSREENEEDDDDSSDSDVELSENETWIDKNGTDDFVTKSELDSSTDKTQNALKNSEKKKEKLKKKKIKHPVAPWLLGKFFETDWRIQV